MFLRKSRDAERVAQAEAQQRTLQTFENRLQSAQTCTDPAEKFWQFGEIKSSLEQLEDTHMRQVTNNSLSKLRAPFLSISGSAVTASVALVAFLHCPPVIILLVAFPGITAAVFAGVAAVYSAHRKSLEECKPFVEALRALKQRASDAADTVLKTDLQAIASSSKGKEILRNGARLGEQFAAAFEKTTAEEKAGPAAPTLPNTRVFAHKV